MTDQAKQAMYEAECHANAYGPIGADECPPLDFEPSKDPHRIANRIRRKARRQRIRHAKAHGYREPGTRAVRATLERAHACGVRSYAIAHEWVERDFDTLPNPVELARLIAQAGFIHVDAWTHLRAPEPAPKACEVCGAFDPVTLHHAQGVTSELCARCAGDLFGDEAEDFAEAFRLEDVQ